MTGQTGDNKTKNVEIMVPLKYLSHFWKALEMPLINCEVNLMLNWSASCVIVSTDVENQIATFAITDTKLYVAVVTLSTQDKAKLLEQLKSGLERVINWNKYLSKPELFEIKKIKNYNIMINGENFLDQPIKDNKVTYENIRNIATGQKDDSTTAC